LVALAGSGNAAAAKLTRDALMRDYRIAR